MLYERSGVSPEDIDVAMLYDAFTPRVLIGLEDFGFCKRGEAGDFVAAGHIQWPKGSIPVNTSGGSLSEVYLHGFNLILEGVRQIRGDSTCQVKDAQVALVASGNFSPTSACILGSEPS
jgi:acetyl-CoA acetyltransferase